jgi:tetratricopeptide (TPR) repeat protein
MKQGLIFTLLAGLLTVGAGVIAARPALALAPQGSAAAGLAQTPLTEKEVIPLIKHNKKHLDQILPTLNARGVDFDLTPAIEKALHKAGATPELITDIQNLGPSARAAKANKPAGPAISPAESQAFQAIEHELDPSRQIQLATAFATQYPKSPLLTYVYAFQANAYQQKNDPDDTVKYGEMSLKLKPDNLLSLMIVGSILPEPQELQGSDVDKVNRLDQAEKLDQEALQIIGQLPKQPNETDAAYAKRKAAVSSGVYASLGLVHFQRAEMGLTGPDPQELAKAEKYYGMAVEAAPTPNPADCYRLGEVYAAEGKTSQAIDAYTKAMNAAQGSPIQQMAQQQIDQLKAQKPASPAAKQ